jgi:hypothetical protein
LSTCAGPLASVELSVRHLVRLRPVLQEDVREYAEEIHTRLAEGTMPCDGPWSAEDVERFRRWIDAGMPR